MCAKDTSPPEIRPRISGSPAERVRQYAQEKGITQSEAAEQLVMIATGARDVGQNVEAMNAKLDRVLQEMQAPGVGAPVENGQVAADGATLEKINYNNLTWDHSEPISREEADFASKDVVRMTPRTRVPVIRGILLDEGYSEDGSSISEERLLGVIRDVFECAPQTAENYLERGAHRSWYPHPECYLGGSDLLGDLKEQLRGELSDYKLEKVSSLSELLSDRIKDDDDEIKEVWQSSTAYYLHSSSEQLHTAYARALLNRIANYLRGEPDSVKWQLMFTRVAAYAREHSQTPEEEISALEEELREEDVPLPSEWWK